jgi:hypothetical protein
VTVGLVGMHIIQKNPFYAANKNLRAQWIWSTFEHVDNAPLAAAPCDPSRPAACATLNQPSCGAAQGVSSNFSYYDAAGPAATNVQPTPSAKGPEFAWSPTQPYGSAYATQTGSGGTAAYAGPQATRCWQIFRTTAALNAQWQTALNQVGSVFANYMLISTQWGANIEPTGPSPVPNNAVPQMLSNVTLETYIQNNASPQGSSGPGSCVSCHNFATLVDNKTPSDFSFLPGLAAPDTVRKAKLRDKF